MTRRRRARRAGRGALVFVAVLLFGSSFVRLGGGFGEAFARASAEAQAAEPEGPDLKNDCETPEELRAFLEAVKERESNLNSREKALRDRMQALRIADTEVSAKLAELEQAEAELRATIALADAAAETDLERLTKVYESMKPKQAAALFEEMDPNFAAGFLGRMRPEAAAEIMAGLSPASAHAFSVVIAGRNAEVPTD